VEYSDALLRDAILREMARGGQAYVLYNRVMRIERFYERVTRLVPEAKVAIGHGQMSERALENVMLDFFDGKYDVLLCTTIIEAGLDVSDANTLVVIDSDRFGLAQLYQLRGRVGRSNRLAYAYLTVQPNKVLTETADKRLTAIREFTEFGSGFRVAMRDLEIRGAGNLLGAEQSGHMASVGYDLYIKMIEETVRELRGDLTQGDIVTRVEARIDAFLPAEYVPNDQLRIEAYKRIAAVESRETREDIIEEMIDRFGEPPRPVMNLIDVAHLKGLCGRIGIEIVSAQHGRLLMKFSPKASLDVHKLLNALERNRQTLTLQAGDPPSLTYREYDLQPIDDLIRRSVPIMEDVVMTVLF
jgi:transcription-repair coupling factor (superfamily II helicase)